MLFLNLLIYFNSFFNLLICLSFLLWWSRMFLFIAQQTGSKLVHTGNDSSIIIEVACTGGW